MAGELRERIGWGGHLRPFLYKELPARTGWTATLGTLCALLFGTMALSGMALAMTYSPSPDRAYQSIDYVMRTPAGALLRGIHHWGAGAMVVAVVLHLLANFFGGTFRAPREVTWTLGVVLLLVTLGMGFTGYLLPWDMKAYWATVVSTNLAGDLPVVGRSLARAVRGGDTVSGLTLTRFYAMHMLVLPALLAAVTGAHVYLVRVHGLSEPGGGAATQREGRAYRFFPEHLWRSALVFLAAFAAIAALAALRHPAREPIAGTVSESYLPRPEWYFLWLFQLLTFFPGRWEVVGTLGIPALGVALLFAAPFLGRGGARAAERPLAVAAGVTAVVAIVYLTWTAFEGTRPHGRIVPVPDRPLTTVEARGLRLFVERECAYCHAIAGMGGHRTGPDLTNVAARHHTREWLARYIRDPRRLRPTSIMPAYDLPQPDLDALAEFVGALDFGGRSPRILSREDALKGGAGEKP